MTRRFRLGAVERLRAGTLAEAARALGAARRELTEALTRRDRIASELAQSRPATPGVPAAHENAAARRHRLREEMRAAGERCSIAASRETAALASWNSARADLRVVELLHERHRFAVAEEQARAEQKETDELAGQLRRPPLELDGLDAPGLDDLDAPEDAR